MVENHVRNKHTCSAAHKKLNTSIDAVQKGSPAAGDPLRTNSKHAALIDHYRFSQMHAASIDTVGFQGRVLTSVDVFHCRAQPDSVAIFNSEQLCRALFFVKFRPNHSFATCARKRIDSRALIATSDIFVSRPYRLRVFAKNLVGYRTRISRFVADGLTR